MRCSAALADGTIDALVSDHNPVDDDAKVLPFAEAEPGATGVELLLSLAVKWSQDQTACRCSALRPVTAARRRCWARRWARCRPVPASRGRAAWPTCACGIRPSNGPWRRRNW